MAWKLRDVAFRIGQPNQPPHPPNGMFKTPSPPSSLLLAAIPSWVCLPTVGHVAHPGILETAGCVRGNAHGHHHLQELPGGGDLALAVQLQAAELQQAQHGCGQRGRRGEGRVRLQASMLPMLRRARTDGAGCGPEADGAVLDEVGISPEAGQEERVEWADAKV